MTGEVTDWKALDARSELGEIQLVFDHRNSSSVRYAIDSLCGGKELSARLKAERTNAGVIGYVAHTSGALGVVGVSWLQNPEDSTCLSFLKRVKVMGVSRMQPATPANSYQPWRLILRWAIIRCAGMYMRS